MRYNTEMNDYDIISPTAYLTAYWRGMSDIPYAKDVSEILGAEKIARDLLGDLLEPSSWFGSVMIETRNKAMKREVERMKCRNIYGLAEGALPTGLIMTQDPAVQYLHTDLPDMLRASENVLRKIMVKDNLKRPNLKFQAVNVLDEKQLLSAAEFFRGKPFIVIYTR